MTRCGADLREIGEGSVSMEEVANKIVRYLYEGVADTETGERSFALVRLFKTHAYEELDTELREFAAEVLGHEPTDPSTKCLTLLATAGSKKHWNSRDTSSGHKVIPLPSEEMLTAFPMISNLVSQLGFEVKDVLNPAPNVLMDIDQRTYNVFYEPNALGSEYIVAQQDFVIPEQIRSCLGFGGMLPSGNLFAVIMFSRVPITPNVASMFRTVSLSVKLALLPFETNVFRGPAR